MTTRKSLSTTQRLKVFTDHGGICCICEGKIDGVHEKWIAEHITPLGLLGEDGGDNLKPAHKRCADAKTYGKDGDLATIAKAKRRKARHNGARLPKGNIRSPGFPPRQKQAGAASSPIRKSSGMAMKTDDNALVLSLIIRGKVRVENRMPWHKTGEICFQGICYSCEFDANGCPVLDDHLREKLRWLASGRGFE